MISRTFSTWNTSTRPRPVFGVDCLVHYVDLQWNHNLRSGEKCFVCDIDLLRLNVLGRIFDSVEFEFQRFSLLRSALLGESAITRQYFSEELLEMLQLEPEWNPVDDDASLSVFSGVSDSFDHEAMWQGDGVTLGCIFLM